MLDIKLIRDRSDHVRERLATRGGGDEIRIDEVLALDEQRRKLLAAAEGLKAQRNRASKEIGALMGQKKTTEAEARKTEMRAIGDKIAELDKEVEDAERRREEILLRLPNIPHQSVPIGKCSADNLEVRQSSMAKRDFGEFTPKPHTQLCEKLGLVDFERGAKLSGSGFLLYAGWGARLERALIQFMLDVHTGNHNPGSGDHPEPCYKEISPPYIINRDCMIGVGQFPKFEDQAYAVQEGLDKNTMGKLYLLPTAEAPVANIHRGEVLKESDLPIRYCAYSPCFRAEAGAAGVGTRGMIRVHQFDKVELIKIVKPEDGDAELEKMVRSAETVLKCLGLHYRVVMLCTGDMGFASAKTYDIEVWAPGQGSYLEVSSCSNCEDFQARRMNLRFKTEDGENRFPHILNGSGTALARVFVALVETHQQADGGISVPASLWPYLGMDAGNCRIGN
ncbi:MAG TPA: serine--tRNA ligase [Candidatus Angelobacter sp.]|nr:serine--tRNA ligase [Candidatus Angelobacter sp.]